MRAAISMVKDEGDIIYFTLAHLIYEQNVSAIIIADNMSSDNTVYEILRAKNDFKKDCHIHLEYDREVGYYQSKKMTALAYQCIDLFAPEMIIPFDADELWFVEDDSFDVLEFEMYNYYTSSSDEYNINPFKKIKSNCGKNAMNKIAFKPCDEFIIEQGNHGLTRTGGTKGIGGYIKHYPYRSFDQFKRKIINGAKAYQATTLGDGYGAHWREYYNILMKSEKELKSIYEKKLQCLNYLY